MTYCVLFQSSGLNTTVNLEGAEPISTVFFTAFERFCWPSVPIVSVDYDQEHLSRGRECRLLDADPILCEALLDSRKGIPLTQCARSAGYGFLQSLRIPIQLRLAFENLTQEFK